MLYDHALHFISIFTMFHAFRCVLECWKLCVGRFGLGWTHDAIIFSMSHVHSYFMHTYPFFSFFVLCCDCVLFLSLIPSLSQIDCAWCPSANLIWLRTLFVLGLPCLLIFPVPLFTFNFTMRRPIRTSLRTFLNVVFIWSAMWFYRTLPTLLYPMSFTLGDENLFVRYPWGVPSCSYRSFTPICTISITKYLSLLWYSEVHVSSHSGSCIRDTTHPAGSTSWLPRLSVSKDYVQRRAFVSLPWDTLYMGWALKSAPCSGLAKGPRFHYLIITPSQSLVLDFFFYPS